VRVPAGRAEALGPNLGPTDPEALARALLAAAAAAPDPEPLVVAAQALLEEARAAREAEKVIDVKRARRA
jgi:hypothetical protein